MGTWPSYDQWVWGTSLTKREMSIKGNPNTFYSYFEWSQASTWCSELWSPFCGNERKAKKTTEKLACNSDLVLKLPIFDVIIAFDFQFFHYYYSFIWEFSYLLPLFYVIYFTVSYEEYILIFISHMRKQRQKSVSTLTEEWPEIRVFSLMSGA